MRARADQAIGTAVARIRAQHWSEVTAALDVLAALHIDLETHDLDGDNTFQHVQLRADGEHLPGAAIGT